MSNCKCFAVIFEINANIKTPLAESQKKKQQDDSDEYDDDESSASTSFQAQPVQPQQGYIPPMAQPGLPPVPGGPGIPPGSRLLSMAIFEFTIFMGTI